MGGIKHGYIGGIPFQGFQGSRVQKQECCHALEPVWVGFVGF